MSHKPKTSPKQSQLDSIDQANKHGYFLQRYCAWKLQSLEWDVREEYPVSLVYESGRNSVEYESSGDVEASLRNLKAQYQLVVHLQSKRRRDMEWFFMKGLGNYKSCNFLQISTYNQRTDISTYYGNLDFTKWKGPGLSFCTIGRELPQEHRSSDLKEKIPKDFGTDAIYQACKEVSFALFSGVRSDAATHKDYVETVQRTRSPDDDTYQERIAYLPVVVTAAKLLLVDFDPSNYDVSSRPTATWQEQPYLIYRFPLPRYLQIDTDWELEDDYSRFDHFNVFMVNYKSLESFARTLLNYFESNSSSAFNRLPWIQGDNY